MNSAVRLRLSSPSLAGLVRLADWGALMQSRVPHLHYLEEHMLEATLAKLKRSPNDSKGARGTFFEQSIRQTLASETHPN